MKKLFLFFIISIININLFAQRGSIEFLTGYGQVSKVIYKDTVHVGELNLMLLGLSWNIEEREFDYQEDLFAIHFNNLKVNYTPGYEFPTGLDSYDGEDYLKIFLDSENAGIGYEIWYYYFQLNNKDISEEEKETLFYEKFSKNKTSISCLPKSYVRFDNCDAITEQGINIQFPYPINWIELGDCENLSFTFKVYNQVINQRDKKNSLAEVNNHRQRRWL